MPEVSVIIPAFNRSHLIGVAIGSVLGQTFDDFELIIVDDCSADDTEQKVKAYDDPRIIYHRNEKNMGAPAARNTGIRLSKGRYLAFLDSDNEWLPQKLEKQVKYFDTVSPAGRCHLCEQHCHRRGP